MQKDIAIILSKSYEGDLVSSYSEHPEITNIQVRRLNNLLVKVFFSYNGIKIDFRAMVSEQNEGTLLLVQEKIADNYILSGVSGFLYKKRNVHGGYLNRLNSFYFHIMLDYFNGKQIELYFFGKETGQKSEKNLALESISSASQFQS